MLIKTIFAATALTFAVLATAQPQEIVVKNAVLTYETEPGCMFSESKGTCVVKNNFTTSISCVVKITGKTSRGMLLGNTRTISVPAEMYDDSTKVFAAEGDSLKSVEATATCTARQ